MRLIDADNLNTYDVSPAYGMTVIGVTEEDIELAPTIRAYSEESLKVFRQKLNKWMFHNSESVCGNSMIDIDYLDGELNELFAELNLPWDSENDEAPEVEARIITHASWIHSKETPDFMEHWTCSHCNHDITENPKFKNRVTGESLNFEWCPYCGSKMSKEQNNG